MESVEWRIKVPFSIQKFSIFLAPHCQKGRVSPVNAGKN